MFSYLRSKMKIVFIIVAAAFLITIFAFWGMDVDSSRTRSQAAFTVNGDDIPIRVFEDFVSKYVHQYGDNVTEDVRKHIRKQAAEDLISQKILEQTAKKLGIYATTEELKGHLHAMFPDENTYQVYLARADARWWQYMEEDTVKRILTARTRSLLHDGVWISDPEWKKILGDLYWEADVSHILFRPEDEVSDSDIAEYYRLNRYRLLEPTKVRTRQILFKLASDAPDSEVQKVTEQAKKILELARAGKDFAALAHKYSESPDAEEGGDMGYYKAGDMVKEVDDVVFNQTVGQISDPVRSEFGMHIFKLEDKIPATIRPWSPELALELRSSAVTDTHWELCRQKARRVLEILQKSPEQFEILAKFNSRAKSAKNGGRVGWAPRLIFPSDYDANPLIGEISVGNAVERDISRLAFETPIGEISSKLAKSSFGWHIVKVHGRRAISSTPPTDTDMSIVRQTYLQLLGEQSVSDWLDSIRKNAKIEYHIDVGS